MAWDPNPESDLAGYVLHWGTQSGVYTNNLNVGNVTLQQVTGLDDGTTYYFVVTAYNRSNLVSEPSAEVSGRTADSGLGGCPACTPGADFNGDGAPDLLWQNDGTRQAVVWSISGPPENAWWQWNWLASDGVDGWRLAAAADFNGDGKPDLVWQNDTTSQVGVWYMGGPEGNAFLGWNSLASDGVSGWRLAATADFNGDGKPDLVWQSDTTSQVAVWYMGGPRGNAFLGSNWLASDGVSGWRLAATADFNGDGKPDLVWQNGATSQVVVWYMGGSQGHAFQRWDWLSDARVTGWSVVGTSDFNGDGKPDLVWQKDDTREVGVWYMGGDQGNVFQGFRSLSLGPVFGWTAIAR